jgi:hypothetical protein
VCRGLSELFSLCTDPQGFTRQVNTERRRLWEDSGHSDNATAHAEIEKIEAKIANIRRAVEDGFADASWANTRLRELLAKRDVLAGSLDRAEPPQLDFQAVMAYCRQTEKVMSSGYAADRKRLMRAWVGEIKLDPESLEVKINYRLPEAVMKGVVAGAGFEPATFGL